MKVREILLPCISETLARSFFAALSLHEQAIGGRVLRPFGIAGWRAQVFFWPGPRALGRSLDAIAKTGSVAVARFPELGIDAGYVEQLLELRADDLERAAAHVHGDQAVRGGDAEDEALFDRCAAVALDELRAFRIERAIAP